MGGAHPVFSDTIGVLTSWSQGVLIVTRRTGESVRIAERTVVAGKVVPPAPARRPLAAPAAPAAELHRTAAATWPAAETERLGDWLLRASGGYTRRANSALADGDPGLPLPEALERVRAWYAARGLPALLQLPQEADGTPADRAAAAAGWRAEAPTLVLTAPLAPVADAPGAERARVEAELTQTWLAGSPRAAQAGDAARAVLGGWSPAWFGHVPGDGGRPAAVGRVAVEGRWAVFTCVETDPAHRRRGLAAAVMAALAARALAHGATGALLQVEPGNAAALALHARLGFVHGPAYHYRRAH
jgi:N-acetylglutamate synthase